MRRVAWWVVVLAAMPAAAAPGDLVAADLGWPTDTRVAAFTTTAEIHAAPGHGKRLANVARGTLVTWRRIVATHDPCKAWLELDQRGWACASDLAPAPPVAAGPVAAKPSQASDAPAFAGVDIGDDASLAFAWAVSSTVGARVPVYAAPDATAAVIGRLAPRDVVTIYADAGAWVRVAEAGWVLAAELRRPVPRVRPSRVGERERWLDVDLDSQVLTAYDGDVPVFATLVSTGRPGEWQTPTGVYRIHDKDPVGRMRYTPTDPIPGVTEQWDVRDVPFVMSFRRNFALHGAYWHDSFGRQRSHGCVNLSPSDARRIYDFVLPVSPAGFTDVEADGDGTTVAIHDHNVPAPPWRDYDGQAIRTNPTNPIGAP